MGQEEEGTFSKLGSTISKLFGGEYKTDEKQGDEQPSEEQITKDAANNTQQNESAKDTKRKEHQRDQKSINYSSLTMEQFSQFQKKLKKLDDVEKEANKLSEDEFSEVATEEEKEKILASCSSVSDWLYEDGSDADAETYEKKLDSLKLKQIHSLQEFGNITNDLKHYLL
ncbi:hypothetical protein HHI36_009626 [Cryptolaemus montrouzieri]|uniref:Uncharacterized protein n=1 Tax=Cryptolaemus montrouzieri TaxID=559131 RepID=A0ABD2MGV7_9CUCU